MDNLISVSDYAKMRNISRQAVYRQIKDGKLSKAVVTVDGKQMLDLSLIKAPTAPKPSKQTFVNSDIDFLRQQIEVKDRQIESLQRTIDALTENLKAAQALHAAAVNVLPVQVPADETESSEMARSDSSDMSERTQTESKSFWQRLFG